MPIHLAISIVEGVATIAVVSFVRKARPEILQEALAAPPSGSYPLRNVLLAFLAAAILTGGVVSLIASKNPDGLEWAIARVTGGEALQVPEQRLHWALAALQEKTAFLPDYAFRKPAEPVKVGSKPGAEQKKARESNLGTSVAGIVGALLTLLLAFLIGLLLKKRKQAA